MIRFFCVTVRREVHTTPDHLGRVTCPACGQPVTPVIRRPA